MNISKSKYVFFVPKYVLFTYYFYQTLFEVMRLETCLNDENFGPQGYPHANLTITSVICYVASVVVPDSVMVNTPD